MKRKSDFDINKDEKDYEIDRLEQSRWIWKWIALAAIFTVTSMFFLQIYHAEKRLAEKVKNSQTINDLTVERNILMEAKKCQ